MTLDPQKKFHLVGEILKYIDTNFGDTDWNGNFSYNEQRIKILLGSFGISYTENFDTNYLLTADDKNINELAEYLLNDKGLSHLFHDKYAIEILATEDKFFNLNLYLNECFECIKADRKIATALLLRCCVEILVDMCGYKKGNLAKDLENFISSMEGNETFAMFNKNNKKGELEKFLVGIKDFGNDAAHLNGKNIKDFIEKYDNKEILKLFCILIEHSILKDDIRKRNELDVENRVKSIDFTIKEKNFDKENSSDDFPNTDDDIPF